MLKQILTAVALCILVCACSDNAMPVSGLDPEAFKTDSTALYVITNHNGMEACFTNFGARLVSLCVPGADGKLRDVVLGFGDIKTYTSNSTSFGALVGPYANRIARGHFSLDGVDYNLEINNGVNCIHSGSRGWRHSCFKFISQSENSLTFGITKPAGQFGLPGDVNLSVTYTLTDDNKFDIVYEASTTAPTVLSITNHTFFNLSGDYQKTVLEDVLSVDADRITPVDETMIPTGEYLPVEGTPFDFRTPKLIGADINANDVQLALADGYDHNFVLNHPGDDSVVAASFYCPASGIRMDVYTDQPGIQVFTANAPNPTAVFKDGKLQTARAALCLETQHFPDSPNHPQFPTTVLRPGEKFFSHTAYGFTTEK